MLRINDCFGFDRALKKKSFSSTPTLDIITFSAEAPSEVALDFLPRFFPFCNGRQQGRQFSSW